MSGFENDASLGAYVSDPICWQQFTEAHTTERLEIVSELAAGGSIVPEGGVFVIRTKAGRAIGEYPTMQAAVRDLQPGGKWWPL